MNSCLYPSGHQGVTLFLQPGDDKVDIRYQLRNRLFGSPVIQVLLIQLLCSHDELSQRYLVTILLVYCLKAIVVFKKGCQGSCKANGGIRVHLLELG